MTAVLVVLNCPKRCTTIAANANNIESAEGGNTQSGLFSADASPFPSRSARVLATESA